MILCSGAFDGLHSGHVAYLEAARALDPSQMLAVAVAPDHYIQTHKHRLPRWTQAQRAATVKALTVVDVVILQREDSVAETIRQCRPQMVVKGQDWLTRIPHDVAAACVEVGATLMFTDTNETHSRQVDWQAIGQAL